MSVGGFLILNSCRAGGGWDAIILPSVLQQQLTQTIGFGAGVEKIKALIELAETLNGQHEPKIRLVDGMLESRAKLLLQAIDQLKNFAHLPESADLERAAYLALATYMPASGEVHLWDGTVKTKEELEALGGVLSQKVVAERTKQARALVDEALHAKTAAGLPQSSKDLLAQACQILRTLLSTPGLDGCQGLEIARLRDKGYREMAETSRHKDLLEMLEVYDDFAHLSVDKHAGSKKELYRQLGEAMSADETVMLPDGSVKTKEEIAALGAVFS